MVQNVVNELNTMEKLTSGVELGLHRRQVVFKACQYAFLF